MPIRFAHLLCLDLLLVFLLSGASCDSGGSSPQQAAPPAPSVAFGDTGNPNGGPGAAAAGMNGTAATLANLIIDYREQAGLNPVLTVDDTLSGVAQWQANDMAANNYVGLVGSDNEDVFNRLANSGYANGWAGVIAGGGSTDPQAVFNALQTDSSAESILLYNGSTAFVNIGIGYSNGYWMIILGSSPTGTSPTGSTLAAPTLSATAGTGSVSLSWNTVSGATSYTVYRGAASGSEASYITSLPGTTYTDTGVTDGTAYYYTVAAVNGSGTSSQSNEVSATPTASGSPPPAPTLSVLAMSGQVDLNWSASPGATSYNIYRGSASGSETLYLTSVVPTFDSDGGVTNGQTYYYTVAGVNAFGIGSQSNEVSATPTATTSLQITTATLSVPTWDANLAGYSATISTSGGTGTVTFTAGPGLPSGLSLSSAGTLSGTPTATGTCNFAVTASDSVGATASQGYTLLINPPVTIVTTTVPNTTVGLAYNASIVTAGGTGAITLSLSSGSLPPGITLNSKGDSGVSTAIFASGGALNEPIGLAFDAAGNLYAANWNNATVAKVTPAGVQSTFVSSGLNFPVALAFDTAGNLYIADYGNPNATIDKVTPAGVMSTFAGPGNGINRAEYMAFDSAGNLYVVCQSTNSITRVTPAGVTSTFVSSGLSTPLGLAMDAAGNFYVDNQGTDTITKVTPAGVTSTFLSGGLNNPQSMAMDAAGNLYVANGGAGTIIKVTPAGATSTFVGGFDSPTGIAFDAAGNLYIADRNDSTITKAWVNGALTGTPTATGTFNFTITATDTLGSSASQAYSVTISP